MRTRLLAWLAPLSLLLLANHCGEYARVNLIEPTAKVAVDIRGADVLIVGAPLASYTVSTNPLLPGILPVWSSSNSNLVQILGVQGDGTAVVRALARGNVTLRVEFGPHSQTKQVSVQ